MAADTPGQGEQGRLEGDGQKDQPSADDKRAKQGGRADHDGGKESGDKESGGKESGGKTGDKPKPPRATWPLVLAGLVVLVFVAVVLVLIFLPTPDVWTDDAYVTAHYATVAPRVAGQIATVEVEDNQKVTTGQLLARIDDRDFRAALATAEAQLERDRAQVDDASGTIARQPSVVDQTHAQQGQNAARLALAVANQARYRTLAATGAGTQQDRQQADAALQEAQAAVAMQKASEDAARKQIPIQEAERRAAEATVKADEARVEQARLNLSYTRILAPLDGVVAQRSVQVGNYVAPGAALLAVVPLERVYIEANYREYALRHILPGQRVRIHVDAYDIDLDGIVDSIPPASGAAFSPIQPNNATGNFTKIVQRLPVKVVMTPGQDLANLLRLGLSVETTIQTGLAPVVADQRGNGAAVTVGRATGSPAPAVR